MDGWKTILSFLGWFFSGASCETLPGYSKKNASLPGMTPPSQLQTLTKCTSREFLVEENKQ